MKHQIRRTLEAFRWHHWLLAAAFVFAVGFTGLHAFRAVSSAIYWNYNRDEPIQGWMNVGFVAHSYHVPPHILYQAIGLPYKPPDRRPLRVIAKSQNRSMDKVKAILQSAIVHARPPYPPPANVDEP